MSTLSPARRLAARVLERIRERGAFAGPSLEAALGREPLPPDDAAFAHRLVYGTLQMRGTLDEIIDRLADHPRAIEPRVRDALRLGVYEILFGNAPAHASVDQGVELVKAARPAAGPLANALLRRVAESAPGFPWGDPADVEVLARMTGHPLWIAELLVARFGLGTARKVLEADNTPAPVYVAHNPFRGPFPDAVARLEREGAEPRAGPVPGCIRCGAPAAAVRSGAVRDGDVIVADAAAQVAPLALGAHPGGVVVDIASGRGTKTALIQALANSAGAPADVYAVDVHPFKARVLAERMGKLQIPQVSALCGDAADLGSVRGLPGPGTADAVLVDAPCTGLGTLRRRPELRWRVEPADVRELAAVGSRLLAAAGRLVRHGGLVVYSTCTLTRSENDDVVSGFLGSEAGVGYRLRRLDSVVPEGWRDAVAPQGWFQSLPAAGGPDGHFVAAIERLG